MFTSAEQRARAAVQRHLPDLAEQVLVPLGQGLDNTAFVVGDLVLRVAERSSVLREAQLLELLAPRLPVPVPRPRFADRRLGVLAYPLLPGRPLLGSRPCPASLADSGGSCATCTTSTRPSSVICSRSTTRILRRGCKASMVRHGCSRC